MTLRLTRDNRGVSSVVSYLLSLAILVLVVSSIGFAGTQHMDRIAERNTEAQLEGLSQQVAYEIQYVDQLVRAGSSPSTSISRNIDFPPRVTSQSYQISTNEVETNGKYNTYLIELVSGNGASVELTIESQTRVAETTVDSGQIQVIRPQPSQSNIDSGLCEARNTNGEPGIQTITDARGEPYPSDTCKITMVEVN